MAVHDALTALTRGSFGDTSTDVTVASIVAALLAVATAWMFVQGDRRSGQH
ncbi:MAG TPA: hypothetical protein VF112_06640 [Candidatus Dormibacteraeota bacterium]